MIREAYEASAHTHDSPIMATVGVVVAAFVAAEANAETVSDS